MQLASLISNIKSGVLENYGTILTSDEQIVFTISNMLNYIYSYRVWKRAIVREEITTTTNVYTLSHNAIHIIKVEEQDGQSYKPHPLPFSITNNGMDSKYVYYHTEKTLTLSQSEKTLVVWYLKIPERLTLANLNTEVDLPDTYIGILYFLCMRGLYPYNLENGASLANNFKSAFVDDMLKIFEKTHALGLTVESVQRDSVFNGK